MYFPTAATVLLVASLSAASPIEKRNLIIFPPVVDDGIILNYALTLECLERNFYQKGIANYSHADVLEGVGVLAYLGAAASIAERYLTAAGAILTIEARHSSYIRKVLGQSPFPAPFDTPLEFNKVHSLAAKFICGGTNPVTLPFKAFPDLDLECSQYYYEAGRSPVTFSSAFTNAKAFEATLTADTPIFATFYSGLHKFPVRTRITRGNKDYKIDEIPAGDRGPGLCGAE